jgi:hypothetical protein
MDLRRDAIIKDYVERKETIRRRSLLPPANPQVQPTLPPPWLLVSVQEDDQREC